MSSLGPSFPMCEMKRLAFEALAAFISDSLLKTLNMGRPRLSGLKVCPILWLYTNKNKLKADFWAYENPTLV